ncbi:hypothetical protein CCMSSC00406_0006507 [Pleurotus cornucopiae]|uniref:Uncharacterized protein n=1 Tax=Pleurotus cornucopiae TaxID=5321 RepID=A0ACB7IWT8_PLECO|nr:hypothetical protein CCMSSC00406_0006507 [Pleurotus cornucopiae]
MPSTVRSTASQTPPVPSKKKFRTVLGFGAVFKDAETDATAEETSNFSSLGRNLAFARKSFDAATSLKTTRRHTPGSSSIADPSFFAPKAVDIAQTQSSTVNPPTSNMQAIEVTDSRTSSRRQPVHVDQDGPWSISVAETPHNAQTYSLYIKTPTHNLTLTRTAMEIVELDQKLRDVQPGANFPPLPIDIASLPPPPKRKSTFLNTLSRLASPTSSRTSRSASGRRLNNTTNIFSSGLPTPLTSPSGEVSDPFSSFTAINGDSSPTSVHPPPSAVSTSIASYLTIISNTPSLRQARVWKRFVRVRTDDLESVRVERAIKRVRSDLAAHVGLSQAAATPLPENDADEDDGVNVHEQSSVHEVKEVKGDDHVEVREVDGDEAKAKASSEQEEPIIDPGLLQAVSRGDETQEEQADQDLSPDADISTSEGVEDAPHGATTSISPEINGLPAPEGASAVVDAATIPPSPGNVAPTPLVEEEVPATPVAPDAPAGSRIHRSKSADPDNVITRLSRAFSSSASLSQDPASSQTEDDSSLSTTGRTKRKKRSKSVDPNKEKKKKEERKSQRKVVIDDFEMLRVLGKGCAGKVLLVRHKPTSDLFALKAITKRHVLAHQELQHTLTEQAVLKRMAAESKDPFVVKLWWSFHDKENLFLVMDFHPGGDLATQLARWGRLGRDRARFYAAEIVEGVEGLHAAGVIYRDLKPENILIGSDGHIVLTDFGLSKEFPRKTAATTAPSTPSGMRGGGDFYPGLSQPATPPWMKGEKGGELAAGWPGQPVGHSDSTSTFCGTAEYLAPEVIQGLPYSYEVDWWSFGTMLYEMLTGITPFWANNHSEMYMRVLQNELQFPDDRAMDQDTKSLIRGLLQRNPALRICEPRIKRHPYFSMIDWSHVYYKRYIPPYIPPIDPSNASDTQNFDDTFLDMEPVLDEFNENEQTDTDQEPQTDADRTDGEESNTTPSQSRSSSIPPQPSQPIVADDSVDVFDGYSFKGRHSVLLDDEEESEESSEMESEEDGEVQTPATAQPQLQDVEEAPEPKTPEARPQPLPEVDLEPEPKTPATAEPPAIPTKLDTHTAEPAEAKPATPEPPLPSKDVPLPPPITPDTSVPEKVKEVKVVQPTKTVAPKPTTSRGHRPRREKSGVPALDKYLSDTADEDHGATTEREDDEDDDWDFIEAADGEDRNGAKGTSLFARGVVDRYRLAVFRKASTPHRSTARSVSGTSQVSQTTDTGDSPTPSQRRGRNPGLTFRRHPRQFLRPKSPPSSFSSKTNTVARSLATSGSATLSAASTSSSAGLLTPSTSVGGSLLASPSLKSKESAMSVGDQSMTSSLSGSEAPTPDPNHDTVKALPEEPEKQKNKKLKKYKENAEKVFSIFSSPR